MGNYDLTCIILVKYKTLWGERERVQLRLVLLLTPLSPRPVFSLLTHKALSSRCIRTSLAGHCGHSWHSRHTGHYTEHSRHNTEHSRHTGHYTEHSRHTGHYTEHSRHTGHYIEHSRHTGHYTDTAGTLDTTLTQLAHWTLH